MAVARFDRLYADAVRNHVDFGRGSNGNGYLLYVGVHRKIQVGNERQQPVVLDEIAILVHDEDFFRTCVDEEADVISERGDDMRELNNRRVELCLISRQFFLIEIGIECEHLALERSRIFGKIVEAMPLE